MDGIHAPKYYQRLTSSRGSLYIVYDVDGSMIAFIKDDGGGINCFFYYNIDPRPLTKLEPLEVSVRCYERLLKLRYKP